MQTRIKQEQGRHQETVIIKQEHTEPVTFTPTTVSPNFLSPTEFSYAYGLTEQKIGPFPFLEGAYAKWAQDGSDESTATAQESMTFPAVTVSPTTASYALSLLDLASAAPTAATIDVSEVPPLGSECIDLTQDDLDCWIEEL